MPIYRVGLVQKVWEEADVYVDAPNKSVAEQRATELANEGGVKWSFLEAPELVEVVSVEEYQVKGQNTL